MTEPDEDFESHEALLRRLEKKALAWGFVPSWREVEDVDLLSMIPEEEDD